MDVKRILFSEILDSLFITFLGVYLIILWVSKALNLYISPANQLFTVTTGYILLFAGIISGIFQIRKFLNARISIQYSYKDIFRILFLLIIIPLALISSHHSLSSQIALSQNSNLANASFPDTLPSAPLLKSRLSLSNVDTTSYTLADWVRIYQLNPESDLYKNKPVSVTGFVQPQPDGTFLVTRYIIHCCIADAIAISLPVHRKLNGLTDADWVRVTGKIMEIQIAGGSKIFIEPSEVQKINQPAEPYL